MKSSVWTKSYENRRSFIGGSDARIIMGSDEAALVRLWREKRGEAEPEDLSGNLIVQLGTATEELNRSWYERNTGRRVTRRPAPGQAFGHSLDGGHPRRDRRGDGGRVRGQVHAALVVLRGGGGRKVHGPAPAQHVGHPSAVSSVLSIITGGGKWVEITIPMDPLYLSVLVSAEKKFWRCVQSGEAAPPDQCRAAAAAHRGDPHRRHELLELLGGVRGAVPQYPRCLSRPRAGEERAQGPDAGGCQGGDRAWRAGQALEIGRGELRRPGRRRRPMPRSSESVAALASALGQGAGRARQSGEVADRHDPRRAARGGRAQLPLCAARRAGSTSCARRWASTRSRPCRPRRSTRPPGWSI